MKVADGNYAKYDYGVSGSELSLLQTIVGTLTLTRPDIRSYICLKLACVYAASAAWM